MKKIKMTINTATDVLQSNFKRSPEELKAERLSVCQKCSHFLERKCDICGCNMFIKATFEATRCPIKKWT